MSSSGHVLSLMVGLHYRIGSGPKAVTAIPYKEWFALALRPPQENIVDQRQMSAEAHLAVIEVGERFGSQGATGVAADLDEISDALGPCLRGTNSDMVIPLAAIKGSGIRLDDLLRTRFVEITVHADDIASSVGIVCPDFPDAAWTIAAASCPRPPVSTPPTTPLSFSTQPGLTGPAARETVAHTAGLRAWISVIDPAWSEHASDLRPADLDRVATDDQVERRGPKRARLDRLRYYKEHSRRP